SVTDMRRLLLRSIGHLGRTRGTTRIATHGRPTLRTFVSAPPIPRESVPHLPSHGMGVRWVYFPAPPSVHEFTTMQTRLDDRILSDLNRQFDASPPEEIVRWALSEPSLKRVAIASAFQVEGTCLIHMAVQARPNVPILFLETGFHFAETLAFKERLTEQLGLNVVDLTGDYTVERQTQEFGARLYERDPKR